MKPFDPDEFAQGKGYVLHSEMPPWLSAKLDQRMAQTRAIFGAAALMDALVGDTVVVMALTDPAPGQPHEVWNESCDRCGKYVPGQLHDGMIWPIRKGVQYRVNYGLCPDCYKEAEARGEHHPGRGDE